MKTLLSLCASVISLNAFAQVQSGNITVTTQERYLGVSNTKEFAQDNLTIKATVDFNGGIEIQSIVQTGGSYNLGVDNVYDFKNSSLSNFKTATQLYLKKLYVKKAFNSGNVVLSAGAMDTGNSIAQTNALSNLGWVDGVRADLKTAIGAITVSAGQIKPTTPNLYDRFNGYSLNYIEITLKRKVLEGLLAEAGVERFQGNDYLEVASKYDLEIAANKIIHFIGEAKVELENGGFKIGAGVQDLLSLFSSKVNQVKLSMNYEYISSGYDNTMNNLSNVMHAGYTGGAVVTTAQFPLSKKLGINGFTNVRVGENVTAFRVESGITATLWNHTFKRKAK